MTRKIRVLHVASIAESLNLFVRPLEEDANSSGYEFLYGHADSQSSRPPDIPLPESRGRAVFKAWLAGGQVRSGVRALQPDIVTVHTPASALAFAPALRGLPTPRVYIARGGFAEGVSAPMRAAWKCVEPAQWGSWDAVLAVNQSQARRLAPRSGPAIEILPRGGVPCAEGEPALPPRSHEGLNVVWVGRFDKNKNPQHFIEVMARVREQVPTARGIMVGGALAGDRLPRGLASALAASDIETTGWVSDVRSHLKRADVLVHTSAREGYGLVFHEAAALGVPAIAYSTEGTRDSIPAVAGQLVPQGDLVALTEAVVKLLQATEKEREQRRGTVFCAARALSAESVWPVLEATYRKALHAHDN